MHCELTKHQIDFYQANGYLLIEKFLNEAELSFWQEAVTEAIQQRGGKKMPGSDAKVGEDDGIKHI
jgi:hypothetical protein